VVVALAALAPPCPSVPPGAGNEPKKAIKPRKRAQKFEKRYVGETGLVDRDVHAPTIRRDGDGDLAAIFGSEPAQWGLHVYRRQRACSVPGV
jgi:hypothetical protein